MVGTFFSELGARVIKIENKRTNGDVTRTWKLPGESSKVSAYYASANYRKEVLLLDLKDDEDRTKLNGLISNADIVITNYQDKTAKKLLVDEETLLGINPQLIIGKITGYSDKPEKPAFDVVLQAESGFISMMGIPKGKEPVKMPVALIDLMAAHQLKEGILAAMLMRKEDAKGRVVSVSLYDAAIASLANQASNYLMRNHIARPMGTQHPNIAPYGDCFLCADRERILLAVGSDAQFQKMCKLLGDEKLSQEFSTNKIRVERREELGERLTPLFKKQQLDDCLALFQSQNIPATKISDMREVFEDPAAQSLVIEEVIEGEKTKKVRSTIFKISQ